MSQLTRKCINGKKIETRTEPGVTECHIFSHIHSCMQVCMPQAFMKCLQHWESAGVQAARWTEAHCLLMGTVVDLRE